MAQPILHGMAFKEEQLWQANPPVRPGCYSLNVIAIVYRENRHQNRKYLATI